MIQLIALMLALWAPERTQSAYLAWYAQQEDYLRKNASRPGWKVTASGLQAKRISMATQGRHPSATNFVTVHYVGKDISGRTFDSSLNRGRPTKFRLDRVIRGWTEGVQLMRAGEKWEFLIPASLAYGDEGAGPIAPGSALRFSIELLAIESDAGALP